MIIYSTQFNVNDIFTKDAFFKLVCTWNQGSKNDRLRNLKYVEGEVPEDTVDGYKSLRFVDYVTCGIAAARFQKEDDNSVVWTVDYILNYSTHKFTVTLEKEISQLTEKLYSGVKPPYLVKMLIEKGYVGNDNCIQIASTPHSISIEENKQLLIDVINNDIALDLPVVFVSYSRFYKRGIDINKLACYLQGVAHVMVEEDSAITKELQVASKGKNAHYGSIAVYYPNLSEAYNTILPWKCQNEDIAMNRIINCVRSYLNKQYKEELETWEGINIHILQDRADYLMSKKDDLQNDTKELRELIENQKAIIFEQQQTIKALRSASIGLQPDASNIISLTNLSENEFFDGEFKSLVLNSLRDFAKNRNDRRSHVIQAILSENNNGDILINRRQALKALLKGYDRMNSNIKNGLKELGFDISDGGKHWKLKYQGDDRYTFATSKTGSDRRTGNNLFSDISNKIW